MSPFCAMGTDWTTATVKLEALLMSGEPVRRGGGGVSATTIPCTCLERWAETRDPAAPPNS